MRAQLLQLSSSFSRPHDLIWHFWNVSIPSGDQSGNIHKKSYKTVHVLWPNWPTFGIYPKEIFKREKKANSPEMFMVTPFVTVEKWDMTKCPKLGEGYANYGTLRQWNVMLLLKGIKFPESVDPSKCTYEIMLRERRRMQKRMYALTANINQCACSLIRIRREPNAANSQGSKFIVFCPL